MNERRLKQLNIIVLIAVFASVICMAVFAFAFAPKEQNKITGGRMEKFNESWMKRSYGDDGNEMIDLPAKLHVDKDEIVLIMHLVPDEVTDDTVLMFKTEFQNVVVMVNDHTVYSYGVMNDQKLLKNAVSCNNIVSLKGAKPGDVISVYLASGYGKYSGEVPDIYIGTKGDAVSTLIRRSGISFMLSVLLILVTLALFVSLAFMNHGEVDRRKSAYAFMLVIAASLWSLTGNELMQLFTKNVFGVYMTHAILFMLLPTLYLMHLRCHAEKRRFAKIFEMGIYGYGVILLTGIVFQMLNVTDFATYEIFVKILMLLTLILLSVLMYLAADTYSDGVIKSHLFANLVLTVAAVTEAFMSLFDFYKTYDGVILQIGLFIFLILLMIVNQKSMTKEMYRERDVALASAEEEKGKLVKKLNTGFIYNTMNTGVNDMKDRDPQNSRLLYDTSIYLRYNLRTIGDRKRVPFTEELAYIKAYLGMQRRNHPGLDVLVEDKITDFAVPFNTVEPLVENAVVNGALSRSTPGKIVVRSYERLDCFAIQIVDNGRGLGPDKQFSGKQSYKSIKKALKQMCGAAIEISSKPDKGTIVTIKVPKEGYIIKDERAAARKRASRAE